MRVHRTAGLVNTLKQNDPGAVTVFKQTVNMDEK